MESTKPLFIRIIRELTARGFTTKNRDKVNDDRLGIKLSFTNETGKYIEIYDEKTYWHILHYGFDGKYHPIGFDILFTKDIRDYGVFLDGILPNPPKTICFDCGKKDSKKVEEKVVTARLAICDICKKQKLTTNTRHYE